MHRGDGVRSQQGRQRGEKDGREVCVLVVRGDVLDGERARRGNNVQEEMQMRGGGGEGRVQIRAVGRVRGRQTAGEREIGFEQGVRGV